MNDHDALLSAIGDRPEEDTPRLAYADWLDENDQPERADFVRNQIELARPGLTAAERHPLVKKNVFYLNNWAPHWKAELPRFDGVAWGDFNRGLIEEVQSTTEEPIIGHAAEIFAVPGIHVLRLARLNGGKPSRRTLDQLLELARLRALRMVAARANADMLRKLLASEHLGRHTVLDLHGNHADDATAEDIADGRFPDLAELWLGSNLVGNRGAAALAASKSFTHIRLLDLRNNAVNGPPTQAALRRRFGSALKL